MTKRRDAGTGTIFRDNDRGGYIGRVTIDGKRYVRKGKTRAIVLDKLNALHNDHARGILAVDQTTTVADLIAEFVTRSVPNRKGGNLSPSHRATYTWAARIIADEIGTKRIAKLTTRDIEAMLDRLAARPMARSSITKVRSVLRLALDYAVRRGDLARNVATVAELPTNIKATWSRNTLTVEMARRLLDGLADERNGAMFALMARLGLRPGEAAGLYWEDLDLDACIVNVTRTRETGAKGRVSIADDLKTARAKRTNDIPAEVVELLTRHRRAQTRERLAAARWVDPRLVFATTTGTPLNIAAVRKQLAALCDRLAVTIDDERKGPRPPLPYELRHTFASMMVEAGVPLEVIADHMGLTSTRMLETNYVHRVRRSSRVAVDYAWPEAEAR